jgi:hypothetical protein
MTSAIDPSVIGAGNIDKAAVRLQLERARDEITALENTRLLKAGDTMTGDLTITKTDPLLVLNKGLAAQANSIFGRQAASNRWRVVLGGPTTSDFAIERYNDSGVSIDAPLNIARGTGAPTFGNPALWRTGLSAPALPTTSGVGQWVGITTDGSGNYSLPAGGTWAYFWSQTFAAIGVAAGGTSIVVGDTPSISRGFAWRIA